MLEEYTKREKELINDLRNNSALTCKKAQERCEELWELIPINYEVNSVMLNDLMYVRFHNDPDWNYSKIYKIEVGNLKENEIIDYLKKIVNKFKNNKNK